MEESKLLLDSTRITNNSVPVFVPEKYKNMDINEIKIEKLENLTKKYHEYVIN